MSVDLDNTWWLAKRQMRDNWASYPLSVVYFAFMGLVLSTDSTWALEFALPILMLILIQPSLSSRYMTWRKDNEVTRHQVFLRGLPVDFSTIISARVIAMLIAGLLNVPVFFLPFWFVRTEWSSFGHFLAWCVFWVGVAFVGAGLALIQEFWLPFNQWARVNTFIILGALVGLFLVMWVTGVRPVRSSVEISNEHPWILCSVGLVLAVGGLWLGMKYAMAGFRSREFAV